MEQLSLEPEAFVEQLPPATKAAVEALRELQSKVRRLPAHEVASIAPPKPAPRGCIAAPPPRRRARPRLAAGPRSWCATFT